jgi:hypothetical protein
MADKWVGGVRNKMKRVISKYTLPRTQRTWKSMLWRLLMKKCMMGISCVIWFGKILKQNNNTGIKTVLAADGARLL